MQVDAALAPRWSATFQFKFAPDVDSDSRWAPRLSWGFLSWRPADDWLLRAGIVLYGLRLTFQDIAQLGWAGIAIDAMPPPAGLPRLPPESDAAVANARIAQQISALS